MVQELPPLRCAGYRPRIEQRKRNHWNGKAITLCFQKMLVDFAITQQLHINASLCSLKYSLFSFGCRDQ